MMILRISDVLLLASLLVGCSTFHTKETVKGETTQDMQNAVDRACRIVREMETTNASLAGFSKINPQFVRDEIGLVEAHLEFRNNAAPFSKFGTSPVDKTQPWCYIAVSVWRPNNLAGQPVYTEKKYMVGGVEYRGYVLAFADNPGVARRIQGIFEEELQRVGSESTSKRQPFGPPGNGK